MSVEEIVYKKIAEDCPYPEEKPPRKNLRAAWIILFRIKERLAKKYKFNGHYEKIEDSPLYAEFQATDGEDKDEAVAEKVFEIYSHDRDVIKGAIEMLDVGKKKKSEIFEGSYPSAFPYGRARRDMSAENDYCYVLTVDDVPGSTRKEKMADLSKKVAFHMKYRYPLKPEHDITAPSVADSISASKNQLASEIFSEKETLEQERQNLAQQVQLIVEESNV